MNGVRLCLRIAAMNRPIGYPQVIYEYGESRRNDSDRGNPKNWKKERLFSVPLCPPHMLYGLTKRDPGSQRREIYSRRGTHILCENTSVKLVNDCHIN
jgi:hypothetical protein